MGTGDRAKRENQRNQSRRRRDGVREKRDRLDSRQTDRSAHDARADNGSEQQRRADRLRHESTRKVGVHWLLPRCLRMTTADAGQADWNSTDSCTDAGTSSRVIGSNPNFGKNRSAVVVKQEHRPPARCSLRDAAPPRSARGPAAGPERTGSTATERSRAAVGVELQCGRPDDLSAIPRDEHRLHVIIDARRAADACRSSNDVHLGRGPGPSRLRSRLSTPGLVARSMPRRRGCS